MNERFTLDSTLVDIIENERVNRKLPILFDMQLCEGVKWPFNKMKLKHMMRLNHFPGKELIDAANFILDRRETGGKITIPVWRDLPEEEMEAAQNVVLIPFGSKTADGSGAAVLICPGSNGEHLNIMTEGMAAAEQIVNADGSAFILSYRQDKATADMARSIRFLRANYKKLGIRQDQLALLAMGNAVKTAWEMHQHDQKRQDMTHRYDDISGKPDQLWLLHLTEGEKTDFDKNMKNIYVCRDDQSDMSEQSWIKERIEELMKETP